MISKVLLKGVVVVEGGKEFQVFKEMNWQRRVGSIYRDPLLWTAINSRFDSRFDNVSLSGNHCVFLGIVDSNFGNCFGSFSLFLSQVSPSSSTLLLSNGFRLSNKLKFSFKIQIYGFHVKKLRNSIIKRLMHGSKCLCCGQREWSTTRRSMRMSPFNS